MLENGNKTNCEFTNEIVSYIYDEISVAERVTFEKHLANCRECTNEFADISHARLGVYEWQREEFAGLRTPEIVIPYRVNVEEVSSGWFEEVRAWLSLVNIPAAVAAALIVSLGVGFLLMNYLSRDDNSIASNIKSPLPVGSNDKPILTPSVEIRESDVAISKEPLPINGPSREVRSIKVVEKRKHVTERLVTAQKAATPKIDSTLPDVPTLSENYEEADDKSLRLSDLFADGDG